VSRLFAESRATAESFPHYERALLPARAQQASAVDGSSENRQRSLFYGLGERWMRMHGLADL